MNIKYIKFEDIKPSSWLKGETYEYYIYPETASYENKEFLFRLSSASINEAEAPFTLFIGYYRYLTMLNNNLDLTINGRNITKDKFEVVEFASEDDVVSHVVGDDLNLMIKNDISEHSFKIEQGFNTYTNDFVALIAIEPTTVFINNEEYPLNFRDALVIENTQRDVVEVIANNPVAMGLITLPYKI